MENTIDIDTARNAKEKAKKLLANVTEVVGLGITKEDKDYVLKVNLKQATKEGAIPREIDGVRLIVEIVGTIKKGH